MQVLINAICVANAKKGRPHVWNRPSIRRAALLPYLLDEAGLCIVGVHGRSVA